MLFLYLAHSHTSHWDPNKVGLYLSERKWFVEIQKHLYFTGEGLWDSVSRYGDFVTTTCVRCSMIRKFQWHHSWLHNYDLEFEFCYFWKLTQTDSYSTWNKRKISNKWVLSQKQRKFIYYGIYYGQCHLLTSFPVIYVPPSSSPSFFICLCIWYTRLLMCVCLVMCEGICVGAGEVEAGVWSLCQLLFILVNEAGSLSEAQSLPICLVQLASLLPGLLPLP